MLPMLPKEMLWTNLETMDEFVKLEPVNEAFFETFQNLRENPFIVKPDAIKLFNEVYYQLTRVVYDHPLPSSIPQYYSDVKANLGWNYSAELVFTMVYFLISLSQTQLKSINKFFINGIMMRNQTCYYWEPFNKLYKELEQEKKCVTYIFKPRPISVDYLKSIGYVNWAEITNRFDLSSIDHVVNLWDSKKDKRCVAKMILESGQSLMLHGNNSSDANQVRRYLQHYLQDDKKKNSKDQEDADEWLSNRMDCLNLGKGLFENETALQNRIKELEANNESLKTLLENKMKAVGKDRKFTLVQIVDYCKGCVAWDDAKTIVAMLNKLLRIGGTKEDSDLVDSIETEFRNRATGNVFHNAQVTMQSPQINTPLYEIKNNDIVNLGGSNNGKQQ